MRSGGASGEAREGGSGGNLRGFEVGLGGLRVRDIGYIVRLGWVWKGTGWVAFEVEAQCADFAGISLNRTSN